MESNIRRVSRSDIPRQSGETYIHIEPSNPGKVCSLTFTSSHSTRLPFVGRARCHLRSVPIGSTYRTHDLTWPIDIEIKGRILDAARLCTMFTKRTPPMYCSSCLILSALQATIHPKRATQTQSNLEPYHCCLGFLVAEGGCKATKITCLSRAKLEV